MDCHYVRFCPNRIDGMLTHGSVSVHNQLVQPTRMRKLALAILFLSLASPAWATTYFLATAADGGNDSNKGTSAGTPWLTPNHAVNCGDVIIAAASTTYAAINFASGHWGTVTCAAGNNLAWLKCVTFDGCKISGMGSLVNGMTVSASYWGVQGWEVDGTSSSGRCFIAQPPSTSNIHFIIFANNIASGCGLSGFEVGNNNDAGVDYFAIVGNAAYGNTGGTLNCTSGLNVYSPVAWDSLPGTHIYVGGNFSWKNVNGANCGGIAATDGEGIIFDTFDGSQTAGLSPYTPQGVADNNILLANGGRGLEVILNYTTPPNAHIYFRHNTAWGNNTDLSQTGIYAGLIGEILLLNGNTNEIYGNIAATNAATGAGSNPIYAFSSVVTGQIGDAIYSNIGWSASGSYDFTYDAGASFTYGPNNLFGTNPSFANAVAPGAPSCGSASSVPNCMATVIANFKPTNPVAAPYGYQVPSTVQAYDPLFPQWLCNVNLPPGLVTMGCLAQSSQPASPTIISITVK